MEVPLLRRDVGRWSVVVAALAVTACGAETATEPGDVAPIVTTTTSVAVTLPLAEHFLDDPDVTTVATDLAPSQATGSTVPDPPSPDPCAVDDVDAWTAQVAPDGSSAVIRIRNGSDIWCEVDIGRSPAIDPAIEPDVWLRPGETADLIVGPDGSGCTDPTVVDRVQVGVGDESALVPSALVTCGWWLTAFYPNDEVSVGCERGDLDVAVTASAVVVRNASPAACGLAGLVSVDGAEVTSTGTVGPAVRALLPGDVVSFGRPVDDGCDGVNERVVLHDETVGDIDVVDVPCAVAFELGPPRPWFGTAVGPPAALADGTTVAVVAALDPFGDGE